MTKTRITPVIGIVPWALANGFRLLMMLAVAVVVFAGPLCWPMLVWHTTVYDKPVWPGAEPQSHFRVTDFGWTMEVLWLLVLLLAARAILRHRKAAKPQPPAAQHEARPEGPRDWKTAA